MKPLKYKARDRWGIRGPAHLSGGGSWNEMAAVGSRFRTAGEKRKIFI